MGAEYYLFALFVFGLVLIIIFLFMRAARKNKDFNKEELEQREQKIMMLYFEVEDMLDELKAYVDTSRQHLDSEIARLETDMQAIEFVSRSLQGSAGGEHMPDAEPPEQAPEAASWRVEEDEDGLQMEMATLEPKQSTRRMVWEMQKKGLSIEQIAKEMRLSKGEVSFMLSLSKGNHGLQ